MIKLGREIRRGVRDDEWAKVGNCAIPRISASESSRPSMVDGRQKLLALQFSSTCSSHGEKKDHKKIWSEPCCVQQGQTSKSNIAEGMHETLFLLLLAGISK